MASSVPKGTFNNVMKRGTVCPHLQAEGPEKARNRKDDFFIAVPRLRVKLSCLSSSVTEPLLEDSGDSLQ